MLVTIKEDEVEKIGMQIVLPYGKHRSELPDDVKKLLAKYNVDYDGGGKLLAGDDYDHFLYVGSLEQAEAFCAEVKALGFEKIEILPTKG
jgi:hypothetical protein